MVLNELISLLKTANSATQINEKRDEIGDLIPAVKIMFDYDQQNHAHQFDLWTHSLNVVINLPRNMEDDMLYLAALFHDIGKPKSQCKGSRADDTNMHYYGHPKKSAEIESPVIIPDLDQKGYKISCMDIKRLLYYEEYHDDHVSKKLNAPKERVTGLQDNTDINYGLSKMKFAENILGEVEEFYGFDFREFVPIFKTIKEICDDVE